MKKKTLASLIAIVAIATVALFSGCIEESVEEMKTKEDVEGLIKALDNWDNETRAEAAKALGETGDESAINPLVRTLKDEDRLAREEAANALEELDWTPDNDTENAYYLIAKEQWNELVKLGEPAIEPLIQALKYEDIGESVSESLAKIGEPAIDPLIQALKSQDYDTKDGAAESLAKIGEPVIDPLIESMKQNKGWYGKRYGLEVLDNLRWDARSLPTGTYLYAWGKEVELPTPTPDLPRALPYAIAMPTPPYFPGGGDGELTVENGLAWDAIAILSKHDDPNTPLTSVYINSEDSYTITSIPDDTYILYYSLGKDWDSEMKKFSIIDEYGRFEEPLEFEISRNIWGTEYYQTYSATLHPVYGGTADTEEVSEDDFPKL